MLKLVIDAPNGPEYRATAVLYVHDCERVRSYAVVASRAGYQAVRGGSYVFERKQDFPAQARIRQEYGASGLLFTPARGSSLDMLLVHGGELSDGTRLHATYGSIRLEHYLYKDLLEHVRMHGEPVDFQLEVRIGSKPSALAFWSRPAREERVVVDDGIDMLDVMWPDIAPFRHPNSALAWMLYFNHQSEEQAHARALRESEERIERARQDERDRQAALASTEPTLADSQPLFQMTRTPGVGPDGRVDVRQVEQLTAQPCRFDADTEFGGTLQCEREPIASVETDSIERDLAASAVAEDSFDACGDSGASPETETDTAY